MNWLFTSFSTAFRSYQDDSITRGNKVSRQGKIETPEYPIDHNTGYRCILEIKSIWENISILSNAWKKTALKEREGERKEKLQTIEKMSKQPAPHLLQAQ